MRSILEEETADLQKNDLQKNDPQKIDPQKIDLQHINIKVLLEGGENLDPGVLDPIIPIFHSWIQNRLVLNKELPELLIDVADYRHVHHGPGIVLVGHEADYSIDNTDGRLGMRYNRKAQVHGTNEEKLVQAAKSIITAAKYLQEDTRLNSKFHFNGQDIEFFVNDRLVAPNNDETRQALDSGLRHFANKLLNGAEYSLTYENDPRRLFGALIRSDRVFSVEELIQNLAS